MTPQQVREERFAILEAWLSVEGHSHRDYAVDPYVKCEADTYIAKILAERMEPNP